mmetsp:Transcript_25174/g.72656  ORF Transcript_25174/g.72656 Transcript_25174/m.72656 type:complete len:322 (-) Transcript_25174:1155-2120(-)
MCCCRCWAGGLPNRPREPRCAEWGENTGEVLDDVQEWGDAPPPLEADPEPSVLLWLSAGSGSVCPPMNDASSESRNDLGEIWSMTRELREQTGRGRDDGGSVDRRESSGIARSVEGRCTARASSSCVPVAAAAAAAAWVTGIAAPTTCSSLTRTPLLLSYATASLSSCTDRWICVLLLKLVRTLTTDSPSGPGDDGSSASSVGCRSLSLPPRGTEGAGDEAADASRGSSVSGGGASMEGSEDETGRGWLGVSVGGARDAEADDEWLELRRSLSRRRSCSSDLSWLTYSSVSRCLSCPSASWRKKSALRRILRPSSRAASCT